MHYYLGMDISFATSGELKMSEEEPPNGPNEPNDVIEMCDSRKAARRARLAAARHFDGNAAKVARAMDEYQGTFPTLEKYVRLEIEDHLAPYMQWMLDGFIDLAKIASEWLNLRRNWVLLDTHRGANEPCGVHVFLVSRLGDEGEG